MPIAPTDHEEARGLLGFIDAAPSPFHACAEAAARLEAAGFTEVRESDRWSYSGQHYLIRGGTLVAWSTPRPDTPLRFRIVGAHTDSPNLRIKPRPDAGRAGVRQLSVEVYGSPLFNSWLGRDLGVAGRVIVRSSDEPTEVRLVRVDRPVLHLPQLAIHLDREVNTAGLKVNPQEHLNPVWGVGGPDEGGFRRFLGKELGLDDGDILGWDAMVHDLTPGALLGQDDELLASGRLDNLCCAFAAVRALVNASEGPMSDAVPVICLFDHEEVGSESASGAGSPVLATVLERLVLARRGDREAFHRAVAGSMCVSADMAHATHPNYPERHDPGHSVELNGGPAIKHNVSQRYATNAETAAVFVDACARAGVPVQQYVHRNDLRCGSTIGPVTAARLGIPVVDVGAPQLAMHSARELMGSADPGYLVAALTAFLAA
ncbi:MAG: M18 family aminopeptidase [Acidimicrobiales bacterium]